MSSSTCFDLEVPARPEYLSLIRSLVVEAATTDPSLTRERLEDLKVAVSEAATNAIEAHVRACRDDSIQIRCTLTSDRIEVRITDHGSGFYPDQVEILPEPDDPARLDYERGLGLYLMRVLTDDIGIHSSPDGTEVRLVVRLPSGGFEAEPGADPAAVTE
ncbi:ATP-binding protein [Candidatus Poriferisocius sp.]|uniref:ATP-binding protein n=1 Tax=Candidatus Poriferisocius sp. TaxID=3101276 RepID=UPI003B0273D9